MVPPVFHDNNTLVILFFFFSSSTPSSSLGYFLVLFFSNKFNLLKHIQKSCFFLKKKWKNLFVSRYLYFHSPGSCLSYFLFKKFSIFLFFIIRFILIFCCHFYIFLLFALSSIIYWKNKT